MPLTARAPLPAGFAALMSAASSGAGELPEAVACVRESLLIPVPLADKPLCTGATLALWQVDCDAPGLVVVAPVDSAPTHGVWLPIAPIV